MKHVSIVKPINSVLVQGTAVQYDPDSINVILSGPKQMEEACKHLSKAMLYRIIELDQSAYHQIVAL